MKSTEVSVLAIFALASQSFAGLVPLPDSLAIQAASIKNGGKSTEGVTTLDGVELSAIPEGRTSVPQNAVAMVATGWTATADSFQAANPPSNAIDGNSNTFWHSEYTPILTPEPHYITIDMKTTALVNSLSYLPRQDSSSNGNIGGHQISCSTDGVNFGTPKVIGTWMDSKALSVSVFEATNARYVKLTALTEAGNRGPWASASEIKIYTTTTPAPSYTGTFGGEWSPSIDFPLVAVSVALEYGTGYVKAWSSYSASNFVGGPGDQTLTATYYPASQTVSGRLITNTNHDMFCEGLSLDANGRFMSTGGNSARLTSIYTPPVDTAWSQGAMMNTGRGYHSQVTLSDGRSFVIGGSWSGGEGNKNGEVYDPVANTWTALPGCPVQPMLTADAGNIYRADNHAWLFGWKGGWVFQAGPSKAMNWYNPAKGTTGRYVGAGTRAGDGDAMAGNAVMYDAVAGKILTVGGAPSYQGVDSTSNAHIITLGNPGVAPSVQTINNMHYQRIFGNSVVQPDGNVMIIGGQVYGMPFSDATSSMIPELWIASTTHFFTLPQILVPRNYHSTAILLPDATIFSGGGGLCGSCSTNHYDAQVFSPGYLFNSDGSRATRPVIVSATTSISINAGRTVITATTDGAQVISYWALIRMAGTTHTVNTDQRRIPLTATRNGNTYTMQTPTDYGILIPGYYMLFASNQYYTPSLAKFVQVTL